MKYSESFSLKLSKLPLVNVRLSFANYYEFVQSDMFEVALTEPLLNFVTENGLTKSQTTSSFITSLLRDSIHGVESYLPGVVFLRTCNKDARNPWKLGGRTMIENYYHKLPALVDPAFSLKFSDNCLWGENKKFYNEIRNPLSHGYEIEEDVDIHRFFNLFEHINNLYKWIDSWHNLNESNSNVNGIAGFFLRKGGEE